MPLDPQPAAGPTAPMRNNRALGPRARPTGRSPPLAFFCANLAGSVVRAAAACWGRRCHCLRLSGTAAGGGGPGTPRVLPFQSWPGAAGIGLLRPRHPGHLRARCLGHGVGWRRGLAGGWMARGGSRAEQRECGRHRDRHELHGGAVVPLRRCAVCRGRSSDWVSLDGAARPVAWPAAVGVSLAAYRGITD